MPLSVYFSVFMFLIPLNDSRYYRISLNVVDVVLCVRFVAVAANYVIFGYEY